MFSANSARRACRVAAASCLSMARQAARHGALTALALWGAGSALAQTQPVQPAPQPSMQVRGLVNSEVSQPTGAFTSTHPIELPAFHGVSPRLAIQYSSAGGNGPLGIGHRLAGLSMIEIDLHQGARRYLLDGEPLVASTALGGHYATLRQGFDRISLDGSNRWLVTRRDGTVLTFETRLRNDIETYRWYLSRVEDAHGNRVDYRWGCDSGSGSLVLNAGYSYSGLDCYLVEVAYADVLAKFHHELRPDPQAYATGGTTLGNTRYRLKSIDIKVNGSQLRAYGLTYAASVSVRSQRSLLTGIRQYGRDATVNAQGTVTGGTSLPATTMTWQDPARGFDTLVSVAEPNVLQVPGPTDSSSYYVITGDFNGDGRDDIISRRRLSSTSAQAYLKYGQADGSFSAAIDITSKAGNDYVGNNAWIWSNFYVGDFDGDGKQDLLLRVPYNGIQWVPAKAHARILMGTSNGLAQAYDFTNYSGITLENWFHARMQTGDFNGDGRTDLFFPDLSDFDYPATYQPKILLANPSLQGRFESAESLIGPLSGQEWQQSRHTLADFNGDGRTDILSQVPPTWDVFFQQWRPSKAMLMTATAGALSGWASDGVFASTIDVARQYGLSEAQWDCANLVPGDYNGDGKVDLILQQWQVTCQGNETAHYLLLANGSPGNAFDIGIGFSPAINITSLYGMSTDRWRYAHLVTGDYNGDRRTDILARRSADFSHLLTASSQGFAPAIDVSTSAGMTLQAWGYATRFGDFDGDGDDDFLLHAHDDGRTMTPSLLRSNSSFGERVTRVDNGYGGSTTITYRPSSAWTNSVNPPQAGAYNPPRAATVDAITVSDGRGTSGTTRFEYRDGAWDASERRHLGYGYVKAIDASNAYVESHYYQGTAFHVGELEEQQQRNASGGLMASTTRILAGSTSAPWVRNLIEENQAECNGDSVCKTARRTFGYDSYGNTTSVVEWGDIDATGDERNTQFVYQPNTSNYLVGLPSEEILREGTTTSGAVLGHKRHSYDNNSTHAAAPTKGDLTRSEVWLNTENRFVASTAAYDSYGNKILETDPLGNPTQTGWNTPYGRFPTSSRNALGHETSQGWDLGCGLPLSSKDPNGAKTYWQYDALCRKTREDRPDGGWTTWSYDQFGTVAQQHVTETVYASASDSQWKASYFDGLGREWRSFNNASEVVDTTYDSRGLVASTSAPYAAGSESPRFTLYAYDALQRLIRKTFPGNASQQFLYGDWFTTSCDELDKPRSRYRDAYGQVRRVREFLGKTCSLQPVATLGTDAFDTEIRYDRSGRQIGFTDARGNIGSSDFDSLGRMIAKNDPDMGIWSYAYDDKGRLVRQTDAKSQQLLFEYDALDRLRFKRTGAGDELAEYLYDATGPGSAPGFDFGAGIGRRTVMRDGTGSTSYSFDSMGRILREDKSFQPKPRIKTLQLNTVARSYDAAGRLRTLTYPDGEVVTHGYDAHGRLYSLTSSLRGPLVVSAQYDARGSLTLRELGNGVMEAYSYDPDRLWMTGVAAHNGSTTLHNVTLTRNARGEVDTRSNSLDCRDNWSYDYDDLRRLTDADYNGPLECPSKWSESFQYDELGRMTFSSVVGAYTYATAGSGHPAHAPQSIAGQAHSYDGNGNLTAGSGNTIGYSVENKPVLVNGLAMSYDGDGNRWKLDRTEFTGEIYEFTRSLDPSGRGSLSTNYYFFNGMRIARGLQTGQLNYYHGDQLNSATTLTDALGVVIGRQVLSPYGRVLAGTANGGPIGLAGQRLDATGLYHMGAREMSPGFGLFVTPDPSGAPDAEKPQSLNRYAYADNSPTNLVDPSGFEAEAPVDEHEELSNRNLAQRHQGSRRIASALSEGADVVDRGAMEVVRQAPRVAAEAAAWELAVARAGAFFKRIYDAWRKEKAVAVATSTPPNRIYSARELIRRADESGPYHNFPEAFNAEIFSGTRTRISDNYVLYTKKGTLTIPGEPIYGRAQIKYGDTLNNPTGQRIREIVGYTPARTIEGTYEIGVRPSASGRTEVITHRFFRPEP